MCQTSVFVDKSGNNELLLENVTTLEVLEKSIKITTLFEGPQELTDVSIREIDFAGGKVYLQSDA